MYTDGQSFSVVSTMSGVTSIDGRCLVSHSRADRFSPPLIEPIGFGTSC